MNLKQGSKVDIHAVARRARVSISTVSRSFNHPDLVHPATRKKIDRAVKSLGYIRNRAAQAMHGKRSGTIGLIVPTIDHAIFGEVAQAFSETVAAEGFTILMASHGFDLDQEYLVARKLFEHRVDGLAVIGLDHAEETFQLIEEHGMPAITMWNYDPASRLSCVGADNTEAGMLAAQELIRAGHTHIATVFPDADTNDRARARQQGAHAALEKAGLFIPGALRFQSAYSFAEAKKTGLDILRQSQPPTAVLCGNDVIAQGVIYAAMSQNLNLPRDLSVVGIGDFKGSAEIEPPLTTIRIPARRIGIDAGQAILKLIRAEATGPIRTRCPLRMIWRASTCAPTPAPGAPAKPG